MTGHDEREDYDDRPWKGQLAHPSVVRAPATALWVIGLVQFLCTLLGAPFGLLLFGPGAPDGPDDWAGVFRNQGFWNLVAICAAGVVSNLLIMRGANHMLGCRRYPWAVTSAVLTMLSVPCIYFAILTVPVGSWALVVLLRRDVRARFDRTPP